MINVDSLLWATTAGILVGCFFSIVFGVVRALSGTIYAFFTNSFEGD